MCDACVIESVKNRMISRRDVFKGTAMGLAVSSLPVMVSNVQAAPMGEHHDLTHTLDEGFPTFSGDQGFFREQITNFQDDGYNLYNLTINEHIGTHMDAPLHFSEDGISVDKIEVNNLIVPLCVIDISTKAESDANAQVTPDEINQWISANGDIPENACVAMYSGWGEHVGTDKFRNQDDEGVMHFPGFHPDATQMLLENTSAIGMAVDTLSLDFGQSVDFATHYAWLPQGRWGLENVANLNKLPASGATIIVGAPKFKNGTGGQCRLFAMA